MLATDTKIPALKLSLMLRLWEQNITQKGYKQQNFLNSVFLQFWIKFIIFLTAYSVTTLSVSPKLSSPLPAGTDKHWKSELVRQTRNPAVSFTDNLDLTSKLYNCWFWTMCSKDLLTGNYFIYTLLTPLCIVMYYNKFIVWNLRCFLKAGIWK